MADKMLIDATHPEETRVVVLRGNRVEEFDFESANRKQLRGNIYLAKVTRVEPSLQAAFVDYGGNRHGFLAFSEIHPDYYQIPVADRQALLAEEERDHRAADADADHRANRRGGRNRNRHRGAERPRDVVQSEPLPSEAQPHVEALPGEAALGSLPPEQPLETELPVSTPAPADLEAQAEAQDEAREAYESPVGDIESDTAPAAETHAGDASADSAPMPEGGEDHGETGDHLAAPAEPAPSDEPGAQSDQGNGEDHHEDESVESVGGADAMEEVQERMPRFRRQYKIQEVIKRRQVMLVQVVKEERGTKGAALTTYLSLAGRYSVLMPNTARGGGISRKITDSVDRKRLKEVAQELEVPEGMGVILRTAGAARTKTEVKRDFEYLLRLWETVRDLTLKSTAPTLVYEEGSLVKRSIRDLYNKEIEEILVAGDGGYQEAKEFMRMLMPSHAKNVKPYHENVPMFGRFGIESQLDAMFQPVVQLRSGGYIVLNQTEALVAIDVNSGRATREHHIEDTALKTNLEASEEVSRQLRLRDLAGLIVIDFIDMDEKRNNRSVERKLSDCLRQDRARIQVGRISHFGLLEMSRQRIRASVLESSTEPCSQCGGSGHVRSVSSVALQLLRGLEEILMKGATHNLVVRTRTDVALYVLNHKRGHLRDLENSFKVTLAVIADPTVSGQQSFVIDRGEQVHTLEAAKALLAAQVAAYPAHVEEALDEEEPFDIEVESEVETEETEGLTDDAPAGEESSGEPDADGHKRKRRRRRSGRPGEAREGGPVRDENPAPRIAPIPVAISDGTDDGEADEDEADEQPGVVRADQPANGERRPRRRGRRGGRSRRGGPADGLAGSIVDELGPRSDPEASSAVADFDGYSEPSPPIAQPQYFAPPEQQPAEPVQPEPARAPAAVE